MKLTIDVGVVLSSRIIIESHQFTSWLGMICTSRETWLRFGTFMLLYCVVLFGSVDKLLGIWVSEKYIIESITENTIKLQRGTM